MLTRMRTLETRLAASKRTNALLEKRLETRLHALDKAAIESREHSTALSKSLGEVREDINRIYSVADMEIDLMTCDI